MLKRLALYVILCLSTLMVAAQATSPQLTPVAEYDIGLECPEAQTLSPDGETLWVLMYGCFSEGYWLEAFNVNDGTKIALENDFSGELSAAIPQSGFIDTFTNPMAFAADNVLSIHYIDGENYYPHTILLSLDGEPVEPILTDDALVALLSTYSEYTESAIYNADHSQAAIVGLDALTVVDLASGESIFSLPVAEETYNAFPTFSADGELLYVSQFDNIEDVNINDTTTFVYQLSDGALLETYHLPSGFLTVSPDGKFATSMLGASDGTTSELVVLDLATGEQSERFSIYEPSRPLEACANDGRDMSDVDFTVSGRFQLIGVNWLSDSSGIIFARSYNGEAAGGGSPCMFNTSRLNRLEVSSVK